jgi:hypothetical protein
MIGMNISVVPNVGRSIVQERGRRGIKGSFCSCGLRVCHIRPPPLPRLADAIGQTEGQTVRLTRSASPPLRLVPMELSPDRHSCCLNDPPIGEGSLFTTQHGPCRLQRRRCHIRPRSLDRWEPKARAARSDDTVGPLCNRTNERMYFFGTAKQGFRLIVPYLPVLIFGSRSSSSDVDCHLFDSTRVSPTYSIPICSRRSSTFLMEFDIPELR